ncbi:MAG: hypothetical protein HY367_04460 [Candidatus Aenigmarchaeota archaeon]|nr:hypothetical protein [Candidatus Aenigmarchaeota archaeon]
MANLYLFRLGKNAELSIAEITSLMKMYGAGFSVKHHDEDILLLELDKKPAHLERLGGTIKAAEVLDVFEGGIGEINTARYFPGVESRVVYGVSAYGDSQAGNFEHVSEALREKLKAERIKASCIKPMDSELSHGTIVRKRASEVMIFQQGGKTYLGRTVFVHNPFEFQKRDIGKPEQRRELAIPPRLSRILINLAGIKSGTLLDPFCGVGNILQEAGLMGYALLGLDRNSNRIPECRRNLEWAKSTYRAGFRHKVINGDAARLAGYYKEGSIDVIATEPYMGPALRKTPNPSKAFRLISGLKPMYEQALKGMYAVLRPGGRVAIVAPRFHSRSKPTRLGIEALAEKAGFRVIDPLEGSGIWHERPLTDFGERHRLIREMHVFEK